MVEDSQTRDRGRRILLRLKEIRQEVADAEFMGVRLGDMDRDELIGLVAFLESAPEFIKERRFMLLRGERGTDGKTD